MFKSHVFIVNIIVSTNYPSIYLPFNPIDFYNTWAKQLFLLLVCHHWADDRISFTLFFEFQKNLFHQRCCSFLNCQHWGWQLRQPLWFYRANWQKTQFKLPAAKKHWQMIMFICIVKCASEYSSTCFVTKLSKKHKIKYSKGKK